MNRVEQVNVNNPSANPVPVSLASLPTITDVYLALKSLLNAITRPPFLDPTTKRVNVANVTTMTTLTTLTTLIGLTNIGGVAALGNLILPTQRQVWCTNIRNRVT